MIFIVKFIYELISSFQDYISTYISNKYTYNISRIVFQKLLRFPMSFFEKYNLGEITSRVNGDIGALSIMVDSQIIELFTSCITLVGMIIIMVKLNIIMFLISCLTAPIIVITNNRIAEQQKKASREIRLVIMLKLGQIGVVISEINMLLYIMFNKQVTSIQKYRDILNLK